VRNTTNDCMSFSSVDVVSSCMQFCCFPP